MQGDRLGHLENYFPFTTAIYASLWSVVYINVDNIRGYQTHCNWDFLGGPVVKTPCSQCTGSGFDP